MERNAAKENSSGRSQREDSSGDSLSASSAPPSALPLVFSCVGNNTIDVVRRELRSRGWQESQEESSAWFHLQWRILSKETPFASARPQQFLNHFASAHSLTSKIGLTATLSHSAPWAQADARSFFPRSFPLQAEETEQKACFVAVYRFLAAVSLLQMPEKLSEQQLETVIKAVKQWIRVNQHEYDTIDNDFPLDSMREEEWNELVELLERINDGRKQLGGQNNSQSNTVSSEQKEITTELLQTLSQVDPQFHINGRLNIWIIKPAGSSRGRGITVQNKLPSILLSLKKGGKFVVQKYIENPLIIQDRKFDIRQWILIVHMGGKRMIYFYCGSYLRFSSEIFSLESQDPLIHLTNNSIQKKSQDFGLEFAQGNMWSSDQFNSFLRERSKSGKHGRIDETSATESCFANPFNDFIQPKMKDICLKMVESADEFMEYRNNSFSLYGVDFMIDEHLTPWLIEVNSSPTLVNIAVPGLVETMIKDLFDVVLEQETSPFYWTTREMEKDQQEKKINSEPFKQMWEKHPFPNHSQGQSPKGSSTSCQSLVEKAFSFLAAHGESIPARPNIGGWSLLQSLYVGKKGIPQSSLTITGIPLRS